MNAPLAGLQDRSVERYQWVAKPIAGLVDKLAELAAERPRVGLPAAAGFGDSRSIDLLSDAMTDGSILRVFAVVDIFSKLCPSLECATSLPAERVTRTLDQAIGVYRKPKAIRTDNGPDFTSHAFRESCYRAGTGHHFIRPGKPVENAFAESFNKLVRDELLNRHCFTSVRHGRDLL